MANCFLPSIFHWVSQSQLMPVWEEYPPPCTAYEAYYLELDQIRFMNKIGDHNQLRCPEDCSVYPFLEANQYRDYDPVSPQTPQSVPHDLYQQPSLSFGSSNTSIQNQNNFEERSEEYPDSITQSPGKQSPAGNIKLPETSFPQISFPVENISSLEQSSEISLEDNKEESEVDVSDDDSEPISSGKKRGSITDDSGDSGNPKKEDDDEEITQPKKRQRTTPEQLEVLEKIYEKEKLPGSDLRKELALKLKMTPRRVQVWFQNKRAKEKRMGISK